MALPRSARVANLHLIGWAPVNVGFIDWAGQFRALAELSFKGACNLETHVKDGKGPESSSRTSWAGMKEELAKAHVSYLTD